jgi:glycosyltransferase involved in cell wall biosynthesis
MSTIVFVNRAGRVSGAEVMLLRLIDVALSRGHRVRVVCPDGDLAARLPDVVEHRRIDELDLGGTSGAARVRAAAELIRRWWRAAAVIRAAAEPGCPVVVNSLLALPAARLARIPGGVSWLVHDTIADAQQRAVIRLSRSAIRHAVAVSPVTAESVRPLGVDPAVSPQGVTIVPMRDPAERADPPVVGIMGALTGWKGHRVLLEALTKVPGVHCEIAGPVFDGDQAYAQELRETASQPALAGRVAFLGHVDPIATMRRWHALVSASTSPEAGPLVALEAMSVGVPVVGTNHGGCAWLLRDGAGVLVPVGDADALAQALRRVLAGGPEVDSMVARARERVVSDHDAEKTYPALLDALLA